MLIKWRQYFDFTQIVHLYSKEQKKAYNRAKESIDKRGSIEDDDDEEGFKKLDGELITVNLEQNNYGLGISLAGKHLKFSIKLQVFSVFFIFVPSGFIYVPLLVLFSVSPLNSRPILSMMNCPPLPLVSILCTAK